MTDPLRRQYSYGYDSESTNGIAWTYGNLLSVSGSNCLSGPVTTSMTYEPTFNQLASIVDQLNHTWSFGIDSSGNTTSITDPLNHAVTLGYNPAGQLTSITDAANDAT